ncbi:MAG: methionyl-tRNA formyltransferase [Myxococcales bacterium]|nr:methionyl-tRNA formyltransferase [Myxococcales bacterium]USN50336.1 MAG: methionyl-tRNA formyltransferase [Myxococcales bacterium]
MARIAFFGTPVFALPALKQLHKFCLEHGHELSMVVTQPDRQQGRGQKLSPPSVKILATKLHLPVFQPAFLKKSSLEGEQFFQHFLAAHIDLAVVVAYGKIIPQRFLSSSHLGFINIHGSLLPKFRGAAPIQRSLECGDHKTGVCLMDMVLKMDEGDIIDVAQTPIIASDTSETLFRRLSHLGAHLLYRRIDDILSQKIHKTPQNDDEATYAAMIKKEEGLLDFSQSGRNLVLKSRAFDPWPGSYAFLDKKRIKFFEAFFIETTVHHELSPGTIIVTSPFLGVKTVDGILYFQRIQLEGKSILPANKALQNLNIQLCRTKIDF